MKGAKPTYGPLCKTDVEFCLHLVALCPFAKAIWYNSQWGLRMDNMGLSSLLHN